MEIQVALLIFTLFSGLAVGSTWLAVVAEWIDLGQASQRFKHVSSWGAYLALPSLIIGLVAVLFHLGKPLRFLNGLSNLGASWLAREGSAGVLFLILAAVYALLWFLTARGGTISKTWRFIVGILSALAGLLFLFSQGMIYTIVRAIPAWNTPLTILFFAVSALLLGTLLVGTALAIHLQLAKDEEVKASLTASIRPLAAVGTLLVVSAILVGVLRWVHLSSSTTQAASQSLSLIGGPLLGLTLARAIVGLLFPLVALAYAWTRGRSQPQAINPWIIASFVGVLTGEVMARALFFLTAVHV
jgi:anaerobic dimethyl sulfoxide reductase subunit C (anchor subunit)